MYVLVSTAAGTARRMVHTTLALCKSWRLAQWRPLGKSTDDVSHQRGIRVGRMDREIRWGFHNPGLEVKASSPTPRQSSSFGQRTHLPADWVLHLPRDGLQRRLSGRGHSCIQEAMACCRKVEES